MLIGTFFGQTSLAKSICVCVALCGTQTHDLKVLRQMLFRLSHAGRGNPHWCGWFPARVQNATMRLTANKNAALWASDIAAWQSAKPTNHPALLLPYLY